MSYIYNAEKYILLHDDTKIKQFIKSALSIASTEEIQNFKNNFPQFENFYFPQLNGFNKGFLLYTKGMPNNRE